MYQLTLYVDLDWPMPTGDLQAGAQVGLLRQVEMILEDEIALSVRDGSYLLLVPDEKDDGDGES